jgi:hypothetical protein
LIDKEVYTTNKEFTRLIVHEDFTSTLDSLRERKIHLGEMGSNSYEAESDFDLEYGEYELEGITDLLAVSLNPINGEQLNKKIDLLLGYDESILSFSSLEGVGVLTSHTLVKLGETDYLPSSLISFHFYTRSRKISEGKTPIKPIENISEAINKDYSFERGKFIIDNVPNNSILFIDGPLIGKNLSYSTVQLSNQLLERNILAIFIVKNSSSNMVTNKIASLKGIYNSDLHWAFTHLKCGQRTNFFMYRDKIHHDFAKFFCYMKPFEKSPQRIEIHPNVYEKFKDNIGDIMDLIYYYYLLNGTGKNQQMRLIAIAEKFARKTIALFDLKKILKYTGVTPTVNEERF